MRNRWIGLAGLAFLGSGLLGLAWLLMTPAITGGPSNSDRSPYLRGPSLEAPYADPRGRPFGRRGGPPGSFSGGDATSALGARIYLYGIGEDGVVPRTAVGPGMMGGGCADCHGADGKGGTFSMMMGRFRAPDIRYSTLTTEHEEANDGGKVEKHEPWTDADIKRSIVDGVEPDGKQLDVFMPRWRLSDREFEALLDYLKELSER